MAKEFGVTILKRNNYNPRSYTLSCTKHSLGNSLELANSFYESGHFETAQPNFLTGNHATEVDDTYFSDQWGLKNTGQYHSLSGFDINICDAWDITQGDNNITVAVIDQGVEVDHDDLNNISNLKYNSEVQMTIHTVYGPHGMAVAGIIGASIDNTEGIAGIAPGTQLMSISNDLEGDDLETEAEYADAIDWAVNHDADVISISWGSDDLYNEDIVEEIEVALTDGRDGLGCVVVVSAGN